jgi:filamentous hemagglutinin
MKDQFRRILCNFLAFLILCPPQLLASGGIQVDQAAPARNRANLDAAQNGVPVVNIARPNGGGLSHNKFSDFNVDSRGVIINNSVRPGVSQLGGALTPNANLGGRSASAILNEVTGTGRTRLDGYTEIFGARADYILANPNGISINGGGFINTPRVTLSTGRPRFEADALTGLDVAGGDILVEGQGVNADNVDAFTLVTRAARINADIHARRLDIVTGQNRYGVADGSVTPLAPDGSPAPAVSIDSSALGGMYAGRIRLVGTEKGVGVNLEGLTRATEDLFLQADGDISVRGKASADRSLRAASESGSVTVGGALAAGDSAEVAAAGAVRLEAGSESILYAWDLTVAAGSLENEGRVMAAGSVHATVGGAVANSGLLQAGSDMALSAGGAVRNRGDILAGNALALEAGADLDNAGTVHAGGVGTVRAGSGMANEGDILAGTGLRVEARTALANSGRLQTGGTATVHSDGALANAGEILTAGALGLAAAGDVDNTGRIASGAGVSIVGTELANSGAIETSGNLAVDVGGLLETTGLLFSGGDTALRAGSVRIGTAGRVVSQGALAVAADGDVVNGGSVSAGETFALRTGGALDNTGAILAQSGIDVECLGSLGNAGVVHSGGSGSYRAGAFLDNTGEILSAGDLLFSIAGDVRNTGGIQTGGSGFFDLGSGLSNDGSILALGDLSLELPGDAVNTGLITSDVDLSLRVGGKMLNAATGQMLAGNNLKADAMARMENAGRMYAAGSLSAGGSGDVRNMGDMAAGGGLALDSGAGVDNAGRLHSGGELSVQAEGAVSNTGEMLAKGHVEVGVAGGLANSGTISTESGLGVTAGTLGNAGVIEAGGGLVAAVEGGFENLGRIFSAEGMSLMAGSLRNLASGVMTSLRDLWLGANGDIDNAGSIEAAGRLTAKAAESLNNAGGMAAQFGVDVSALGGVANSGSVRSGAAVAVNSGADLENSGEFLAVGNAAYCTGGDLSNTGVLHSGGNASLGLGGSLANAGRILSQASLLLDAVGDADNAGIMGSDGALSLYLGGSLLNAAEVLADGDMSVIVGADLRNLGRMETDGWGAFDVAGAFFNQGPQGRVLAQAGLGFEVLGAVENYGVLHSGDALEFLSAGLVNGGQILAQGNSLFEARGDLTNTGFLYAGGMAEYGVDGTLRNDRGEILSQGDMRLAGATPGTSMAALENEAGSIETLEGSMSIRAKVVRNINPDLVVKPGTEVVSRQGGRYSFFSDNWDQAQDLYDMLPSSSLVPSKRDSIIIVPAELQVLGLGLDRNAFPRAELDAAIAATEVRFAASGGTAEETAIVASLKNRLINKNIQVAIQHFKDRSKVAAYVESVTRDEASGLESGATIAAANDLEIVSDSFLNSASTVSTASGDISIDAASFINTGAELYEHRTIEWARGHANEHSSPRLTKEGGGIEVVDTPIGNAYGSISAGGTVSITADHLTNGITENVGLPVGGIADVTYTGGVGPLASVSVPAVPGGQSPSVGDLGGSAGPQPSVIAPPRPEDLSPMLGNLDDLIGVIPANGLFAVNVAPGHRYLIETNPALTSMSALYGSDYFLEHLDVDISRTQQQLLGDAFYETRLVRDQIFALTGRRLLSSEFTSDAEQLRALLDNAIAAHEALGLSVGVSLTADQVAALDTDLVWLETRVVAGREVLVPVVYLCSGSMATIARGGSVIYGRDVDIRTSGDTENGGVIQALGELAVSAKNIFNSFGTMQGSDVNLAATESLYNTSGLIRGGDVSISAGQDIIADTAKTTFSQSETSRRTFAFRGPVLRSTDMPLFGSTTTTQSTSETVGRRGSIEATGDLAMQAGRDIGIVGSDVRAGGDISLDGGRDVAMAVQELESHSKGKTGSAKSRYDTLTSKESTVEAGGSVGIRAGGGVVVRGSTVAAGEDVRVEAGNDAAVVVAQEGYDYRFKQKSKGGLFGKSSSESLQASVSSGLASVVLAGDRVVIETGQGGVGDAAVVGSRVVSGGDMALRAADGILISASPERRAMASASSESSMFSGRSEATAEIRVSQLGSEVLAGNDLCAEAKNVAVSASRVHAGRDAEIASSESDVIVAGAQTTESAYSESSSHGWNFSALLDIPLAILGISDVEIYSARMDEAKNSASLNTGSAVTAGNNLEINSARDAAVIGSAFAAGNNVEINAARDVNLIPGLTAHAQERKTEKESIGFSVSWSENEVKAFAGVTKSETGSSFTGDYNAGSLVSAGNDVGINAGNNINQYSSDVEAGRDARFSAGNDINVGANANVEHMEQYAREIQIGVTASAKQSVTTAARALAETPQNMAAGEGSDEAKGITAASSILRGVSAAQQLTNVGASASITAGVSVSQSSSFMDAADAATSSIQAGRDAALDAERDVRVSGAAVLAAEDVTIEAGRDVAITSATNTYSTGAGSFSASAGVGVGASYSAQGGAAAGIRVQADAETLSVTSGADTTVAGANLEGKSVAMDVGGDLMAKSEQDKRAAAGSNWSAGGSVTFGYGVSAEAHVGMGKNSASSAWVNRQTSVIGQEGVDIRTEKNTHVEGAVIAAENDELRLDTGTLTYKDIKDRDTSKGFQASLSGSYSSGGDSTGPTFDGSYGSSDRRQINRATVGKGEIIIRSDPAKGLEGLNRDLRRAREIAKDEQTSVVVYFDSAAIQEIASGFAGIRGNLETLGELVKQALPDDQRLQDSVDNQLSIRGKLIEKGMTDEQVDAMLQKYALYADLMGEIGKLVDAKGGWSNLTEAEAQAFVDSLQRDSRFVTLLASSDNIVSDSQAITINSGKYLVGTVTGGLQAAGSDTKSVLLFLNDMSGYMLYSASGGLLFQENAINLANTVHDFTDAVVYLSQNIDEVGPAVVEGLEKKWNDYLLAVGDGDYYRAGNLYGEFYYEVGTVLVTAIGTAKSLMSGLKSAAPKFAATVEAAEAARVAKVGDEAVGIVSKSGQKLLGASIKWTEKDLAKVISKHGPDMSGKGGTLKSRFFSDENIADLITSGTHQQAVKQVSGNNFERVFDVGRNIGIDVKTGKPTSIMTIVTQPSGRLVTAFPGTP